MINTHDWQMSELADRGEPLADSPHNCYLEVDPERRGAVVVWSELLAFHAERNGSEWAELTDADGRLTEASVDALMDQLADQFPMDISGMTLGADGGVDEPNIRIEVDTDYHEGETFGAWFDRIGWPIVAALINVTDPGTFNSPYVFSAARLREAGPWHA